VIAWPTGGAIVSGPGRFGASTFAAWGQPAFQGDGSCHDARFYEKILLGLIRDCHNFRYLDQAVRRWDHESRWGNANLFRQIPGLLLIALEEKARREESRFALGLGIFRRAKRMGFAEDMLHSLALHLAGVHKGVTSDVTDLLAKLTARAADRIALFPIPPRADVQKKDDYGAHVLKNARVYHGIKGKFRGPDWVECLQDIEQLAAAAKRSHLSSKPLRDLFERYDPNAIAKCVLLCVTFATVGWCATGYSPSSFSR